MNFTDLPSSVPHSFSRLTPSWMNRLIDAVRRRTIIAGRGIRASSSPNGTVISLAGSIPKVSGGDDGLGDYPWKLRLKDGYLDVYVPDVAMTYAYFGTDGSSFLGGDLQGVLNSSSGDADWYRVCSTTTHIALSKTKVIVRIYKTSGGQYAGVYVEGVGNQQYDPPQSYETIWMGVIGNVIESNETIYDVESLQVGILQVIEVEMPKYGTQLAISDTNSTAVSTLLLQIANRMPSGGGALAELSDSTPVSDNSEGDAGDSEKASRANHAHPLNVSASTPEMIPVDGFESGEGGKAGSSDAYARADHEHPFPLLVANGTNEDEDASSEYIAPDGGGGSTGATQIVQLGSKGDSIYAAALDHSHPLNVDDTTANVIDILKVYGTGATEGDYKECIGTSSKYARADHTHPISGISWLANDTNIPTGSVTDGTLQKDSETGSIGQMNLGSPIDHSHPLNVSNSTGAAGESIKPVAATGVFGSSKTYSKEDHQHPLPTDGTGAAGVGEGLPQTSAIPTSESGGGVENYGTGYNSSWSREANFATSGNGAGVKISIVTKVQYLSSRARYVAYFRTLTFDAYGLLKSVSAVTASQVTGIA